jgi:purine-cytosine permease-like protein
VATTLVTGASLWPAFSVREALGLVGAGSLAGAALVAVLAAAGPRLGVPSIIALRAAMGARGAAAVAVLLYLTNFAWIAVNNVIAASALARVAGGPTSGMAWAVGLGLLATAVVAAGPRMVGHADRVAVPVMAVTGALLLWRGLHLPPDLLAGPGSGSMSVWRGLDVVIAYQVSWVLMFADYSRYTASARAAVWAVFLGLATTAIWFMPIGVLAARAAGSADPGAMIDALGLGVTGAVLMAFGTITTNFVNIYLSALAWKSLVPGASPRVAVWVIGVAGSALSLFSSGWLDRYADLMIVLGSLLVPIGGILIARFVLPSAPVDVPALYRPGGPDEANAVPAAVAWALGAIVYFLAESFGGTLPALATSALAYRIFGRRARPPVQAA